PAHITSFTHICAARILTLPSFFSSFFFNATPTTEIYTLSLHDALPISAGEAGVTRAVEILRADLERTLRLLGCPSVAALDRNRRDRKSTRLNSSHSQISYAVFCLKKKKKKIKQ